MTSTEYWEKEETEKAAKCACGLRALANNLQIRLTYSLTNLEIATDAVHEVESHIGVPAEKSRPTT